MGEDEKKLFVGRLPYDIMDDEIRMIFGTYGKVQDVHIMPGQGGQGDRRCAFVTYETVDGAKAAIQVLDNIYKFREDAQDPIRVSVARPRGSGKKGGGKDDIKGGKGWDNFEKGGRDEDYKGGGKGSYQDTDRRDVYDRGYDRGGKGDGGYDRGYDKGGYDRGYEKGGYDRGYDRGGYDRGYDRKGYESKGGGGGKGEYNGRGSDFGGKSGRKGDTSGTKLYVGNLPHDITREALEMVFSTYGNLEDVHIMTGRSKSGQSCSFILYSEAQDAKTAIAAMQSGYEIRPGEGDIIVKFADTSKGKPRYDSAY